jgi:hypothetical protein
MKRGIYVPGPGHHIPENFNMNIEKLALDKI